MAEEATIRHISLVAIVSVATVLLVGNDNQCGSRILDHVCRHDGAGVGLGNRRKALRLEVLMVELLGQLLAVGLLHFLADGDGFVIHALRVEGRIFQRRDELGAISAGKAARTGGLALGGLD